MKKNKILSKQHILKFLRCAGEDLPILENRCQQLSNDVLELQFRKKKLGDEVAIQCSSISQLEVFRYKTEIEQKKQIISNLDRLLNQKSNTLEEKLTRDDSTTAQVTSL